MSDLRIIVTGAGGQPGSVIAETYATRAALSRHLQATAASRVRPADPALVLDAAGRSDPR
jgi:quinol monooxygenase YgiN